MQPKVITLNQYQYRYAFYENSNTDEYGVFLMGTLQDIESVHWYSQKFSEHINLFVVEVPGMGLTEPLLATFSMQDQADMLAKFINHFNITNAHLFSFSYSAPIAVELCIRTPKNIASLSMYGGMIEIPEECRSISMAILCDAINDRKKFSETFIRIMTTNAVAVPRSKVICRGARQKIIKQPQKQIDCFCENTLRLLTYKPSSSILSIVQPVVLIVGEQDPYVTVQKAKELALKLPRCSFEVLPNADHLAHLEYPDLVAQLMMQFIQPCFHNNSSSKPYYVA